MKSLLTWLDERTGLIRFARTVLHENIPGGASWRYVWGSTLVFCIAVQFFTGIFLWMDYSPSAQTAWESVNYIQNEMFGGWLLRGMHHYMAQLLPVLLVLYLMQVIIDGAYKAPREVNFWVGLMLMQVVLLMALTGYQLPWDQKGFWATKVAMNILGIVPFVGHDLQRILIGGTDYGHLTLTRFFAVHAGFLPAAMLLLLALRFYLNRRHGFPVAKQVRGQDAPFWPDQALKNLVACLAVLATILYLIMRNRIFSMSGSLGAELGAPVDPSEPYSAARPEWYFLFMFQFLKQFPGQSEIWGAIIIPSVIMLVVVLMPFIARRKLGHRFNVAFLCTLVAGAGLLTYLAKASDSKNLEYQQAVKNATHDADRVKVLAHSPAGIPSAGAITLLRTDPLIQGPKLFAKNCASCHRFQGHDGMGIIPRDPQSASDLAGFGSRAWLEGLLDPQRIGTTNYFGATKLSGGKMSRFVKKDVAGYTPAEKEQLKKVIAAISAEAGLKAQSTSDQHDAAAIAEGRNLLRDSMRCTDCHQFRVKDPDADAPDLTGYASREWLIKFLNNPAHDDFYGSHNDRMPAFGEKQALSPEAIGLIADWLRGDWYEPVINAVSGTRNVSGTLWPASGILATNNSQLKFHATVPK
ncbi:MAG: menaquinol-cytochrome reductase [Pedosphaera sp.]|nr:menaquinol-cytochrome reductase [Pedosphaera sp.]